jgi:uncharacterized protein
VVERILADVKRKVGEILGDTRALKALDPRRYADDTFGEPTVRDILSELDKPGRDPRPAFKTATFKDGIDKLTDLVEGMMLEGVVTNVTNFGAFVDVGVHQDGLVHVSMLADRFVKDPHSVVKAGDVVKVKVLEVDPQRKRISLTMRMDANPERKHSAPRQDTNANHPKRPRVDQRNQRQAPAGSMAAALSRALKK